MVSYNNHTFPWHHFKAHPLVFHDSKQRLSYTEQLLLKRLKKIQSTRGFEPLSSGARGDAVGGAGTRKSRSDLEFRIDSLIEDCRSDGGLVEILTGVSGKKDEVAVDITSDVMNGLNDIIKESRDVRVSTNVARSGDGDVMETEEELQSTEYCVDGAPSMPDTLKVRKSVGISKNEKVPNRPTQKNIGAPAKKDSERREDGFEESNNEEGVSNSSHGRIHSNESDANTCRQSHRFEEYKIDLIEGKIRKNDRKAKIDGLKNEEKEEEGNFESKNEKNEERKEDEGSDGSAFQTEKSSDKK